MTILFKPMLFCGQNIVLTCDARCDLAWGRNWQGERTWPAPEDPGTYEGPDGKPTAPEHRLNRWCARECERSVKLRPDPAGMCEVNLEATWVG